MSFFFNFKKKKIFFFFSSFSFFCPDYCLHCCKAHVLPALLSQLSLLSTEAHICFATASAQQVFLLCLMSYMFANGSNNPENKNQKDFFFLSTNKEKKIVIITNSTATQFEECFPLLTTSKDTIKFMYTIGKLFTRR